MSTLSSLATLSANPPSADTSSLAVLQRQFLSAVYAQQPLHATFLCATATERMSIYRHNTQLTLIELLRSSYPVMEKIVGADFFQTLAFHYQQQYPPACGDRHVFGAHLTDFIATFEPAAALVYLSDLARLEWRHHLAYFADDASLLTFEQLQQRLATNNDTTGDDLRLPLHPSVSCINVQHNVLDIWSAHQQDEVATVALQFDPHHLLIWRNPQHDVLIRPISGGLAHFLQQCPNGFLEALPSAAQTEPNTTHTEPNTTHADFQTEFAFCMTQGIFIQPAFFIQEASI